MCQWNKWGDTRIDPCMRNLIKYIPNTFACCCGHGKYPMTIVVKNVKGEFLDIVSGIIIPRSKRFYKRDNHGVYYIPEVIENGKK